MFILQISNICQNVSPHKTHGYASTKQSQIFILLASLESLRIFFRPQQSSFIRYNHMWRVNVRKKCIGYLCFIKNVGSPNTSLNSAAFAIEGESSCLPRWSLTRNDSHRNLPISCNQVLSKKEIVTMKKKRRATAEYNSIKQGRECVTSGT